MIRPGLCSVTLRGAGVDEVIAVAARAGLAAIEWGGDVHVPPGDVALAEQVRASTERAGLAVASYGSYFLRRGEPALAGFDADLRSAVALGAPRIRIWAGSLGSSEATSAERDSVVQVVRDAADLAAASGVELGFEFHGGTLTDSAESTVALLDAVNHPAVRSYWQPPVAMADDDALAGLGHVVDRLSAVHVFSWWPAKERLPLDARRALWERVFARLPERDAPLDALLEFVPSDSAENVVRDAATLRELLA